MLRVLVVDDEEIIRRGIIRKVQRLVADAQIVGEAADGEQALLLVEREKPDIVLTDIKMPIIDGLMFIEKALEASESTKFIIFSGYNDFGYAQKALRLGVCDYLLKPIDNDELVRVIREAAERIDAEKQQRRFFKTLTRETQKDQIALKNSLVGALLDGGKADADEKLRDAGYALTYPRFTAFMARISSTEGCVFAEENAALLKFAVCNICEETLAAGGVAAVVDDGQSEEYVQGFLNHTAPIHTLKFLFENAVRSVAEHLGITIFFGTGRQYESLAEVPQSCAEARKSVLQKHIYADSDVIWHEDYLVLKGHFYVLSEEMRNLFLGMLENADEEPLIQFTARVLADLARQKVSYGKVVEICIEIMLLLINFMKKENSYSNTDLEDISVNSYFSSCIRMQDFEQLLCRRIRACCAFKRDQDASSGRKIIQQIVARIDKEYFNDLKLSTFARQYFLNQSYLSQLFATETGENFSTYISVLRIKKAKELLKSTNFSTSKVGELVGYKERSYFTRVFEKYEKKTPYQYREAAKKNTGGESYE